MDKLNLHSKDILSTNIDKIGEIFPGVITEAKDENGATKKAIDFDILRQYLSDQLVEGDRERFRLDWPGKRASILKANTPTTKTLRPMRADSEEFDTTQNIFIEGDNFEVLKVLQESYLGKVKMIYIDPPYNTGKDFIYRDNFAADKGEYEEEVGVRDDENGGKLVKNTETNGRYHSDWLSMMQERLIVARDLLTDDGVIFISIDDNEQANLKTLCNEVFGEENLAAEIIVTRAEGGGLARQVIKGHDYLFVYARNIEQFKPLMRPKEIRGKVVTKDDGEEYWIEEDWLRKEFGKYGTCTYDEIIKFYDQKKKDEIDQGIADGKYILIDKGDKKIVGRYRKVSEDGSKFYSIIKHLNKSGLEDIRSLDGLDKYFDFPKPVSLVRDLVRGASFLSKNNGDLVLDFFSGSATTAHAVMQLNAEDGGNRKHIQVQLAEPTDPGSEAYKAGYKTIPEISRERIRRAAAKIRGDYAEQIAKRDTPLDTGFRAYKLASSNFTDTRLHPSQTSQTALLDIADTIKPDRTSEDILTEVILDLGLTLDLPIEQKQVAEHTVYFVGGNALVACFDGTVSLDIVDDIAAEKPLLVVFKDSSFASDEVRINIDIRLKQLSPDTKVKVI